MGGSRENLYCGRGGVGCRCPPGLFRGHKHLRKRLRTLRQERKPPKKKMGTMDRILVLEAVFLVAYTVADLVVFWHTGSEPATLTGCVFGVCDLENGVMGWIKTNKDKAAEAVGTSGSGTQPPPEEPPAGTGEPPDAGL